ncbi:MAG: hypothetical protein ACREP9_14740, partial [Candidatus Dormibacteraceae bacterium]
VKLAQLPSEKPQVRTALLELMHLEPDASLVLAMASGVGQLAPTAEGKRQTRNVLLTHLTTAVTAGAALSLVDCLTQLDPTDEEKRQARNALLTGLIADTSEKWASYALADRFFKLDLTPEEKRQARRTLLMQLITETDTPTACRIVDAIAQLDPTAEEKQKSIGILTTLLSTCHFVERDHIASSIIQLKPTIHDLSAWPREAGQPSSALLAAARRNSPLASWLAGMPILGMSIAAEG